MCLTSHWPIIFCFRVSSLILEILLFKTKAQMYKLPINIIIGNFNIFFLWSDRLIFIANFANLMINKLVNIIITNLEIFLITNQLYLKNTYWQISNACFTIILTMNTKLIFYAIFISEIQNHTFNMRKWYRIWNKSLRLLIDKYVTWINSFTTSTCEATMHNLLHDNNYSPHDEHRSSDPRPVKLSLGH